MKNENTFSQSLTPLRSNSQGPRKNPAPLACISSPSADAALFYDAEPQSRDKVFPAELATRGRKSNLSPEFPRRLGTNFKSGKNGFY